MSMPQFTADASLYRTDRRYQSVTAGLATDAGRVSPALRGHWNLFGCEVNCIEVCVRFCSPTDWACCQWETRCSLSCPWLGIQIS